MKGIPLSDEEYISSQEMFDSFKPEILHKNPVRQSKRPQLAHLSNKSYKQTPNSKRRKVNDEL